MHAGSRQDTGLLCQFKALDSGVQNSFGDGKEVAPVMMTEPVRGGRSEAASGSEAVPCWLRFLVSSLGTTQAPACSHKPRLTEECEGVTESPAGNRECLGSFASASDSDCSAAVAKRYLKAFAKDISFDSSIRSRRDRQLACIRADVRAAPPHAGALSRRNTQQCPAGHAERSPACDLAS